MSVLLAALAFICAGAFAAEAPQVREQFIDGPWGQIHVRVAGEAGQPTAILLHQVIWSADQFRAAQRRLAADGLRTIAVDIPGNGTSRGPEAPVALAGYADALVPVVKAFGLSAVNIVGVGEGGIIASAFAAVHADMVQRLVLDGVAPFTAIERERYHSLPRFYVNPRADGSHLPAAGKIARDIMGERMTTAALQSVVTSVYAAGEKGWFAKDAAYAYDLTPDLRAIKAPVLLLDYAGQSRPQAAAAMRKLRPDFSVTTIEAAHPAPSFDDPDVWADAVAAFLIR